MLRVRQPQGLSPVLTVLNGILGTVTFCALSFLVYKLILIVLVLSVKQECAWHIAWHMLTLDNSELVEQDNLSN